MKATEMHDLLHDVQSKLEGHIDVWRAGDPPFGHIQYCRFCHYSQSHGHGDDCIIKRLHDAVAVADTEAK